MTNDPRAVTRSRDLISGLVADLSPVKALRPPWLRALLWLSAVVLLGLVIVPFVDMGEVMVRLRTTPDMWLAMVGSALTAVLAALAAFELALPDRRPLWGLLPLPGLALWIAASGLGCLRSVIAPGTHTASLAESMECLKFIAATSLPLSILLFVMLRRGFSMRPNLTGALGGLAAASAAATLLNLCHPFDAALSDLSVHVLAVALVVAINRLFGGLFFASGK